MSLKQQLMNRPALYDRLLSVLNAVDYFNIRFRWAFPKYQVTDTWKRRAELVKQSPDNDRIHHVADAGRVNRDHQVMHNGLKISLASYYDYGNTVLIRDNRGVHEPQEEYVFQEILKHIPAGGTMLELGSHWAFYPLWFAHDVKNALCYMVEPDPHKMNFGKLNFKLNGLKGTFELGFMDGKGTLSAPIPVYTVDYLMAKHRIPFLNILHSDIQGYEANMLRGAEETLRKKKVGYILISTHSNELHRECTQLLQDHGYDIVCSADLDETYSRNGVLVAKNPATRGPQTIDISKRKQR